MKIILSRKQDAGRPEGAPVADANQYDDLPQPWKHAPSDTIQMFGRAPFSLERLATVGSGLTSRGSGFPVTPLGGVASVAHSSAHVLPGLHAPLHKMDVTMHATPDSLSAIAERNKRQAFRNAWKNSSLAVRMTALENAKRIKDSCMPAGMHQSMGL